MDHYHHMHQKCSLDRSSQVKLNLRGAVLWLKYAMSFQDAGQRDEVTPKAHKSSSSSHTFSIDMMLIRDELLFNLDMVFERICLDASDWTLMMVKIP